MRVIWPYEKSISGSGGEDETAKLLKAVISSVCGPNNRWVYATQEARGHNATKYDSLTAYIRDEIVSMKKSRDLPNDFGGADIFGGKVEAGYVKLSFGG